MRIHVLDASAWLRLFLADGPMLQDLEEAAKEVGQGNAIFAAPDLILVEAANALSRISRRGALSAGERDAVWKAMRRTPIDLLPSDAHIESARSLAEERGLTVYDALYLAIAFHIGVRLFTADKKLARAALARASR